jgi:hypothetical protein
LFPSAVFKTCDYTHLTGMHSVHFVIQSTTQLTIKTCIPQ